MGLEVKCESLKFCLIRKPNEVSQLNENHRNPWSEDDDIYLEYYLYDPDETSIEEVCHFLGRTKMAVEKRMSILRKENKAGRFKNDWSKKEDDIIKKFWHKTGKELAELLPNRTPGACRARRANLGIRKSVKDFSFYHDDIIELAAQGFTRREIARKLGISYNALRGYVYTRKIDVVKADNQEVYRRLNHMLPRKE